ncbi:U-box domain-containing protein [Striga asiatica]|uniref:RING-type E3 ubiquitin transferase n=1 Tax=Striga asiatica TaxID=4170 RepID=A0A5A7RAZ7_STRAF|nr:U-box domain-containing protein [Striga asiatica]
MAEIVPIGTILAVLSRQIIKTAAAANDILLEHESFGLLSKHLLEIDPILTELQSRHLSDSPAARLALESLESDINKANSIIHKYKNRARFYLLLKCRHIVKQVQHVTREIETSFSALSLASVETLSGISERVKRLQDEVQRAQHETSRSRLEIVDKLEPNNGPDFANDMLKEIARAVGVRVDPDELDGFRREKEEAEWRIEKAEVLFLEQVIELLSRADAARDYEHVKDQYLQRVKMIERYDSKEEFIEPFKPFFCCITGNVMVDPVSLCTGTACEREALEAWFERGENKDPETGEIIEDFTYRPNVQLRQSIQEWRELNYCVKIRSCRGKLLSGFESCVVEGLSVVRELVRENSVNRDWVSIGGLTDVVVSMVGSEVNEGVRRLLLMTLKDIVDGHARNKEIFMENKGIEKVVPCLGMDSSISKAALELLHEVLLDKSGWNTTYCRMLSQENELILHLVSLRKTSPDETAKLAEEILLKLCEVDEDVVIRAAKVDWFRPLIDKLIQGSTPVKIPLVRDLFNMELDNEKIKLLGEEGIIPPLLEMVSENIESKEVSLQALVKLSTSPHNKPLIASSGGVPLILNLLSSPTKPVLIISKCAEILSNLSSNGDGTKFLVDKSSNQLDLHPVIMSLLSFQENLHSPDTVRKPALRSLLAIFRSDSTLVKFAVLFAGGVSVILPLLDDSNQEIRELAINLLFLFSHHEPDGIVEYLLKPRRLEALVGLLENPDVHAPAAGLLANLPKSETSLTGKLIELGGLKAIVSIVKSGTDEAREHALGALFRFTDPTSPDSQRAAADLDAYGILADLLDSGSDTARARAAALLGDLSMRSHELSLEGQRRRRPGCRALWARRVATCPAHGGPCGATTTFCLLEGGVVPGLVRLMGCGAHEATREAIQTLSTLVREDVPGGGARVLHENGAIGPIIEVLRWGSEWLKGEALGLLEKVFLSRDMVEVYGPAAMGPLVQLAGRSFLEGGHLQRKATRVLLLIERCSRSSTSLVAGFSE